MNYLLQVLNISLLAVDSWQLHALNSIVAAAQNKSIVFTLALFGRTHDIEPYMRVLEQNYTPRLVVTRNYGDINFSEKLGINREIFFIAVAALESKALWNHLNNAFRGIQGHAKGVFITTRPKTKNSRLELQQHFQWCWSKGLTNALILVDNENPLQQQYEIYNYNHFLQKQIINMTLLDRGQLYPDKFRNLHSFKIRSAALLDPPRVFEKRSCKAQHKQRFLGYAALLFQAFLKEYNAEMDVLRLADNKSSNIMEIVQRIENDEIDLSINPYIPHKNAHLSYPVRMLQRCVVVPYPEELPKYKFFIMPFQSKVWSAFLATWLIMSLAKLFAWHFRYKRWSRASTDVGRILLEVWRLMMYLPTYTSCHYKDFQWFHAAWFMLIAIMGFIFSNLYMAILTSLLADVTFKPLIGSLAELVDRRFIVNAVDYEVRNIISNHDLPKDFFTLLRARNGFDLLNDILSLRPNQSYTALEDRIHFALNQQIHLQRPISQMVRECLTTMPLGFLMPAHSPFEKPLNRFILRSSAAGLIDKWTSDSVRDGYCSGILIMRLPKLHINRPLTLQHFQFGWFVLCGGHFAAIVVFLLENCQRIWKRFKIFIIYY